MEKYNILILNTGGTFNKVYNPLTGNLDVPNNNVAIESICNKSKISNTIIDGLIFKDSLDMTDEDRQSIVEYINHSKYKNIIIVHGTDTMDKTASYLNEKIKDKNIILTGAMIPYSIEQTEAVANLMSAYGFLKSNIENGVYICMHGLVENFNKIVKNKKLGIFECL